MQSVLMRMRDHEVDKFLTRKPSRPHIVTLTFDYVESDFSAHLSIPPRQLAGVLFYRHHSVNVTVYVIDGNMCFSQRLQAVDRIVLSQLGRQLLSGHAIRPAGVSNAGVTAQIAYWIDSRDAGNG